MKIIIEKKKYGQKIVFKNAEWEILPGLSIIYGVSGSGKSTLFNILRGFDSFSGKFIVNNVEISDIKAFSRQNFSFVWQDFKLIDNLTVQENIFLEAQIKNIKIDQALFRQLVKKLQIANKLDQKVTLLSGGEKQRIAIARSILTKPQVLFLDEPTGNLDQKNSRLIFEMLQAISHDIPVVVISHDQTLIDQADNRYHLKNYAIKAESISNESEIIPEWKQQTENHKYKLQQYYKMRYYNHFWKVIPKMTFFTISFLLIFCITYFLTAQVSYLAWSYTNELKADNIAIEVSKITDDVISVGALENSIFINETEDDSYFTTAEMASIINNDELSYSWVQFNNVQYSYLYSTSADKNSSLSEIGTINWEEYFAAENNQNAYETSILPSYYFTGDVTIRKDLFFVYTFGNSNDTTIISGREPQDETEIVIPGHIAYALYGSIDNAIGQTFYFEMTNDQDQVYQLEYEIVGVNNEYEYYYLYSPNSLYYQMDTSLKAQHELISQETDTNFQTYITGFNIAIPTTEIKQLEVLLTENVSNVAYVSPYLEFKNAISNMVKIIIFVIGLLIFATTLYVLLAFLAMRLFNKKLFYELQILRDLGLSEQNLKYFVFYKDWYLAKWLFLVVGILLLICAGVTWYTLSTGQMANYIFVLGILPLLLASFVILLMLYLNNLLCLSKIFKKGT